MDERERTIARVPEEAKETTPADPKKEEAVDHPPHYAGQGGVECIEYIEVVLIPYQGVVAGDIQNILKYTWRCRYKNGLQDLEKAVWYAHHLVRTLEKQDTDPRRKLWGRVNRLADVPLLPEESSILRNGMAQVEKNLSSEELPVYREMMSCFVMGNLHKSKEYRTRLIDRLERWCAIYQKKYDRKPLCTAANPKAGGTEPKLFRGHNVKISRSDNERG